MITKRRITEKILSFVVVPFALIIASALGGLSGTQAMAADDDSRYTSEFPLQDCTFETMGTNRYFVLRPGYQLVLEGQQKDDEGDLESVRLVITVLDETQDITLAGIGTIQTRVVEEREWADGEVDEVSRNFFAMCKETSDIYYFGEDVDIYDAGQVVSHDGAWRAGENDAMPGIVMPGTFLLGSRYFQEMASGVAMDRAENVLMGIGGTIQAGTFDQCVGVLETSSIETTLSDYKFYCPGVGLVADADADGVILLVSYGDAVDCGLAACGYWDY
jgi:hypothetical protein